MAPIYRSLPLLFSAALWLNFATSQDVPDNNIFDVDLEYPSGLAILTDPDQEIDGDVDIHRIIAGPPTIKIYPDPYFTILELNQTLPEGPYFAFATIYNITDNSTGTYTEGDIFWIQANMTGSKEGNVTTLVNTTAPLLPYELDIYTLPTDFTGNDSSNVEYHLQVWVWQQTDELLDYLKLDQDYWYNRLFYIWTWSYYGENDISGFFNYSISYPRGEAELWAMGNITAADSTDSTSGASTTTSSATSSATATTAQSSTSASTTGSVKPSTTPNAGHRSLSENTMIVSVTTVLVSTFAIMFGICL